MHLAQSAKHTRAPHKLHSDVDKLSPKNRRRIAKLRSKKLAQDKSFLLESRLRKVSHSHKKTKKELEEQIKTMQVHLELYKDKFEKLTKDIHSKELSKKNQERLGSLVLIEEDLHLISDQLNSLSSNKNSESFLSLKKSLETLQKAVEIKKNSLLN